MINGQRVVVVMPAFNAAMTLRRTVEEIDRKVVDHIIVVDDHSTDTTMSIARKLDVELIQHARNLGYGGNQKTCYRAALRAGADIVVMVHPDYQYSPNIIVPIAAMVAYNEYDFVIGSRILGIGALAGGMPRYKFYANRILTAFENVVLHYKLSEYHSGLRAFRKDVLTALPLDENSNDFVFDNQMIAQALMAGFRFGEVSCPTRYMKEASSINLERSIIYGLGVLQTSLEYRLHRWGWRKSSYLTIPLREEPQQWHVQEGSRVH